MALVFYRQRDIDEMDVNNIPEEFINYFETLDDERKAALIGTRPDIGRALGFVLPAFNEEKPGNTADNNTPGAEPREELSQESVSNPEAAEDIDSGKKEQLEEDAFAGIRTNRYEGQNLNSLIRNGMQDLEALCISDHARKCPLHRVSFVEKHIKYISDNGAVFGVILRVCPKCNRIYLPESRLDSVDRALTERGISHTFYPLDLTTRYLHSQMPPHEFGSDEAIYFPDTWIEENPICPVHDTDLYEIQCRKRYKDREVAFKGYYCDQCEKVIVRRTAALDLEDECGRLGIAPIRHLPLRKKAPEKKAIPPRQIESDYIIENGRRTAYKHNVTGACYQLTEEDTVVVSDSIYCEIAGHETNEVAALIWLEEKRNGKKAYLFRLGYCSHCQKYYMEDRDYKRLYSCGRPAVQIIREIDDEDYLITSGEVFNLERTHLDGIENQIKDEIKSIKKKPDYVSRYAIGSYDDGGLAYSKYISARRYQPRLNELESYAPKPYSYRVDITHDGESETYYIGAADIMLDGELQVISANSDFGHELVNYQTIKINKDGKEYSVKLTRQFDIDNAFLYGYSNLRTDEDVIFRSGITDPFLVRVLNTRKRQHNLTDIFVTIQENQNRIVNTEFGRNIIVQGCAGSGKTMVLLHRLSSLKYREKSFDFSHDAMILTPNDQFTLHISGLANELQIGNIHRVSVEQYYLDTLLQYSPEFKMNGKIASEMLLRQDYVDYIYSDQFRENFSAAYDDVMAGRNALIEKLDNLTDAMSRPRRKIDLSDDSRVIQQIRNGIDAMNDLVERRDSEIASAIEEHRRLISRKQSLSERAASLTNMSSETVQECLAHVNSKIGEYLSERQQKISEVEKQLEEYQAEYNRVQSAFIFFGRKTRLEELEKDIEAVELKLNAENQNQEELQVFGAPLDGLSDEELISWMRQVMLIIPTVQDEVRRCARVREEYTNIEKELGEIDSSIEAAFQTAEEKKKTGYSDEVKQAIKMLSNEVGKYTVLKTFQRIFDQAVVTFEKANALKNTRGNVFRHDLYARLLFAMKFYGKAIGTIKFMCIDEGQDLAFNEYRLLYELNQYSVVFNIFGDTNQLIKKGRGISDWKDLKEAFGAQPYILNENYRNTNQITRFCNSSFGMNVMQTGVDGPNVREIARKELENELSTLNISNERIAILVPRSIQKSTWLDMTLLPRNISWIIGDKMDNGYISLMYVDEVKGIEFDKAYVVSNGMSRNEKYIAYTRALSELVLVMDAQAAG